MTIEMVGGRFVWLEKDKTSSDYGKICRYYYDDHEGRKSALKYVSRRTYDYSEDKAYVDGENEDSLVYRRIGNK